MPIQPSYPGPSNITDSTAARKDFAGLIVRNSDDSPRGGIFIRTAATLVTARGDMKIDVAPFRGLSVRGGGVLLMSHDLGTTLAVDPAPVSNARYDIVYFKQNEGAAPYADGSDLPILAVFKGASAAIPNVNTVLADLAAQQPGAEPIASIYIPAGAVSTQSANVVIKDIARFTAASGGTVPFRTKADLDLWTTAAPFQRANVLSGTAAEIGDYIRGGTSWERAARAELFSTPGSVLYGSVPPAGTPILRQAGMAAVNTNASGDTTLLLPRAFPNGLISARLDRCDFRNYGPTAHVLNNSQGADRVNFRVYAQNGTVVANASAVPYVYEVIGW